jgi:hypothetical protein
MEFDGIEVIQFQPGEVNLAVSRLKGDQQFAAEFKARFSAINGIQQVEPDPVRGEVVVLYDKKELTSISSLLALKQTFSHFFPEIDAFRLATWLSRYI